MCEHGDTVSLWVPVPPWLSHNGELVWRLKPVDACLAEIVSALNAAGALTANCCCGHGRQPAEIILHDRSYLSRRDGVWSKDDEICQVGL